MKFPPIPARGGDVMTWASAVQGYLRDLAAAIRPAPTKARRPVPTYAPFEAIVSGVAVTESAEPEATGLKVKINPLSTLLKSEALDDVAEITGLDTEWTISGSQIVALKAQIASDGSLDTAEILSGEKAGIGWGEDWKPYQLGEDFDGDENKSMTCWLLLAYLRTAREGERASLTLDGEAKMLICPVRTHLQLQWKCSEEAEQRRIRTLAPWHGGFTA